MVESVLGVFVVTFLAMLLLFGEILVRLKGIGAILGIISIGFYFSTFLTSTDLILVGIGFVVGLALIIMDGKFINDGILGSIGLLVVIFSVAFAAPNGLFATYSIAGVILGAISSLILLKIFPKRKMWGKMALFDQLTSDKGYNSMNDTYKDLIDQQGKTVTVLRPIGTVDVNGQMYSAISRGKWIEQGVTVSIVEVDGTKIVVEEKLMNEE
ncbi:NfeD family protein [Alkalibacillus aidingensis]|uniref:NfeD family protein n=1 Tax=Alkalibacillus aidingensis TaxID=2747607 RepID=UPI001CB6B8CB|nr:NfeD family protein [Alkalibacillus aidingensis]